MSTVPSGGDDLRARLEAGLRGSYTIERELGGGGMSRVFLAEETALGRKVVIKVLPGEMAAQLSVDRFKREIALAARLQHAHIVPLLSAGDIDGLPYFTMPYVEGESLRARLAREGEVPLNEAVRELREVASALAYAHAQGVVHRDIKPDNVLLSGGAAMVTDFGVAKAVNASATSAGSGLTSVGVAVGTPAYMSPEQASADPAVDHRADLYAWGVLAYELLAGEPPFAGRTPQAMLAAHLTQAPEPVSSRRPSVPPAVGELVMRCLEKAPDDRPQSAVEVVDALDAFSTPGSGTAPASRTGTTPSDRRPGGRRVGLITVAVMAVVAVAGWALLQSRPAATPPAPRSVAVLPFENVGGDSTQAYFAAGMTDDIASALVHDGVRVAPRASAMALRDKTLAPQEVGAALSVDAVLTGRVSRLGSRLRVAVELADTRAGVVLGSYSEDRETSDLFEVQRAITDSILGVLRISLGASPAERREHQEDPAAHDLVLQGRYLSDMATKESLNKAISLFNRAIEIDPEAISAYVGLAYAWNIICDHVAPPISAYPQGQLALERALRLDSLRADVWAMQAGMTAYEWDWTRMSGQIDRARALNPDEPLTLLMEVVMERMIGNGARAIVGAREYARLDPLNPVPAMVLMWTHFMGRQYDSAVAQGRRIEQLAPGFAYLDGFPGYAFGHLGRYAEAESTFTAAEPALGHRSPGLAWVLALQGKRTEARAILAEIERDWDRRYVVPEMIAWAYDAVGDTARSYYWLEKGLEVHSWWGAMSAWWPAFDSRRTEPRYQAILRKMNLLEAVQAS